MSKSKKILVAFDSATMRNLLIKTFDDAGYKTAAAVDGLDLLNKIYTERPDTLTFQLSADTISRAF